MTTKNFVVKNGLEAGNITLDAITNIITTTGNVNAANLLTGGQVSATGNVTGNNLNIGNIISAGGNITGANILTVGNVSATGAVLGSNVYVSSLGSEQIAIAYTSGQLVGGIDLRWEFANAALWATNIKSNGNISTSGNITGANLFTSGVISTSGNINSNNLTTTGNISANNASITGILSVSGNLDYTGANAYFSNVSNIKIPGGTANYVLTTDGTGNVSWQPTGQGNANVAGNNTEVQFNDSGNLGASANFTFNKATNTLTANFFVGDGSNLANIAGGNVTGTVANATHACTANVVTDGTQSNITAVGTLTSLSVSGDISGANISSNGNVSANGNVTGNFILGNGYYLTGVVTNSSTILNGNSNVQVEANSNVTVSVAGNANVLVVTGTGSNINGYLYVTGNINSANANLGNAASANFFIGSGNNLSNIQGANVSGTVANANYAAYAGDVVNATQSNITTVGTLINVSVSGNANVGNLNTGNLVATNANLGNTANANYFIGSGNNLSNIQGANVTGTVANATHASTANTVVDATQSNITSVGTLTNLSVSGNANVGSNINVSGNAVITGNLVVGGNTVYVNVETIRVEDPIIELGGGPNGDPLTNDDGKDRGTLLHYYAGAPIDAFMGWDNSNGEFALGSNVSVTNEVVTYNTFGNLRLNGLIGNTGNFTGNISAANANLGNAVTANYFIGSGANLTNINAANITGTAANANYANFAGTAYSVSGSNVSGEVANANYASYTNIANTANSVAGANVSGTVANANYATYSGTAFSVSGSNVSGEVANANYATYSGTAFSVSGSNVSGTVANANYSTYSGTASSANSVAGANVSGEVANANYATYSGTAFSVSGSNVSGTVANANYATYSGTAASANSVAGANVSGEVANANYASYAGVVTTAAQPNITSVGTLTGLTVGPNSSIVLSGNTGFVKANSLQGLDGSQTLYLYYGSVIGAVGVVSDLTVGAGGTGNVVVSGTGNITGNLTSANANLGNLAKANYFQGDGGLLSNISVAAGSYIVNGTSNVHLDNNGNLHVDIAGNTDKLVVTGTGANVNGYLTVSGNLQSSNANLGNAVTANYFIGSGNNLSNILLANISGIGNIASVNLDGNASNILYGNGVFASAPVTYGNSNVVTLLNAFGSNTITTTGNVSVGNIIGNGQALTGINGANVTGTVANANYAAYAGNVTIAGQSNITSVGILTSLSVSGNIDANNLNTSNIVSATGNVKTSGFFVGDGGYISNVSVAAGSYILNGTSNVHLDNNGNLHVDIAGNTDRLLVTNTGIIANVTISAIGNITGSNLLTGGNVSATGNLDANNLNVGNIISATGNVTTANYFVGNGYYLTGIASGVQDKIANGNSNVYIPAANGNVTITAVGNANVVVITGTGINVAGYANMTGNVDAANANLGNAVIANYFIGNAANLFGMNGANVTGTVANATHASTANTVVDGAQSNITSVGTLTSLSISGNTDGNNLNAGNIISAGGNITGANILTSGNVSATGNLISNNLSTGNIISAGGNITGANINTGGLVSATGNVTGNNINAGNIISATGNITTANFFVGDGGYLTNVTVSAGSYIVNGTSNVHLDNNGNLHVDIAGNTDRLLVTSTGIIANSTISAIGNITGANLLTGNEVSATGNITTANYFIGNGAFLTGVSTSSNSIFNGNSNIFVNANSNIDFTVAGNANVVVMTGTGANINGYANITGNANIGNIGTGLISASGNITGANLLTGNEVSATGNITSANYFIGNGFYLTGIASGVQDKIANGNSNVYIPAANGNVTITAVGNANVVVVTGTGVNIAGYSNITGNANIGNIGTEIITATGNITGNNLSAGNLISTTDFSASGNAVIAGNLTVSGTTEYINVTNLAIKDPIISIGRGTNNAPLTTDDGKDRGEQLWYYSGSEKSGFIGYDNSAGKLIAATDVTISSEVVTVNTYGNLVIGGLEANTISTVGNINTANSISATGNVDANNLNASNTISATGNITTANYFVGNGYYLTGLSVGVQDKIANGNSNVYIPTANGNVTITAVGNANVVVITGTGANINGYANISGNLNANVITGNGSGLTNLAGANVTGQVANALVAGTVYTNAQPNITSVGTLTSLTVGPNSSIIASGNTGYVRANSIQGRDGSQAIYPYYGNISGAVGIVTDLTVGASGGGNLTVANGNVAFSGANVSLGDVSNLHIGGGTLNYFLKTNGSGDLSWALPSASPGGVTTELQFNDTGVFQGTSNLEFDSTQYRLSIQNYSLVVQTLGGVSGATTINITDGCYVTATSSGITTWIFTFPAPSANASGFVLELTNGGTYTQNWPLSVRWPGGSAPDLTATGVDLLVFVTNDNGTTWRGALSMLNST